MNDDENNNSIDDLITYSDDEGDDAPEEDIIEIEEAEDYDEEYEDEYPELDIPYYIEENHKNTKKDKDRGWIFGAAVGVLIGIAAIIAFISIDSGIIGTYKTNFANNFSHIFANFARDNNTPRVLEPSRTQPQYKSSIKSSVIVAPENASEAVYVPFKTGILCASENHLSYISMSGETVWETDTAVVDPLLAAEGNYILLAEKDRNKLCLYADKKLLYDVDDPDNIMAVKVSAHGDAVLVTDKSSYRGGISVYNKAGEQIYSWASGRDTVISADISSASRRVAVALLNTETKAKSVMQLFDVNQTQSYSQIGIEDTVIYNVEFSGSMLTAFGDNRLVTFTEGGKVISDIVLGEGELTHSAMDSQGNKLLSFYDGAAPSLHMYTRRGADKGGLAVDTAPDFIDIEGKQVIYNAGRDIYFGKFSSRSMLKYTATMDIKNLILLSDDTYVVIYSNSFEIIRV